MKRMLILAVLVLGAAGAAAAAKSVPPQPGQETADKEPRKRNYTPTAVMAVRG